MKTSPLNPSGGPIGGGYLPDGCKPRSEAESRRHVAYIGWFLLRPAIREAGYRLDELERTLKYKRKRVTRRGVAEYVDLTDEELADVEQERNELQTWIARMRRERRENGLVAGDLIDAMDRRFEGLP